MNYSLLCNLLCNYVELETVKKFRLLDFGTLNYIDSVEKYKVTLPLIFPFLDINKEIKDSNVSVAFVRTILDEQNGFYDIIDWKLLIQQSITRSGPGLTEEIIEEHIIPNMDCFGVTWKDISKCRGGLSESFIKKYFDFLDWDDISRNQKLSEEFVEEYLIDKHFFDFKEWGKCTYCHRNVHKCIVSQDFSTTFFLKYIRNIYVSDLIKVKKFTENEIEHIYYHTFFVKHHWDVVSLWQLLSESFIEKYSDYVNWSYIIERQKLSQKFIEKMISRGYIQIVGENIDTIIKCQHVDDDFVMKYINFVNINSLVTRRKLSEQIIKSVFSKVTKLHYILTHQDLSLEFIEEIIDTILLPTQDSSQTVCLIRHFS